MKETIVTFFMSVIVFLIILLNGGSFSLAYISGILSAIFIMIFSIFVSDIIKFFSFDVQSVRGKEQ